MRFYFLITIHCVWALHGIFLYYFFGNFPSSVFSVLSFWICSQWNVNSWFNPLNFILFLSYFPNLYLLFPTFCEISSASSSNLSIECYPIITLLISKSSYLFSDFSRILFLFHKLMLFFLFPLLPFFLFPPSSFFPFDFCLSCNQSPTLNVSSSHS